MIRDRDRIYGDVVTRRLRAMGIRDQPTAPASPWQNGFVEWLIGSIRRECVDHIIVLGEAHLRRILKSYARYYNATRTHLALDKDAPLSRTAKRGRAYSLPPSPRRIASRICPDLISDRHRDRKICVQKICKGRGCVRTRSYENKKVPISRPTPKAHSPNVHTEMTRTRLRRSVSSGEVSRD